MPESNPSEQTKTLYQSLREQSERIPINEPSGVMHSFTVKLDDFRDVPDEVRMEGDDFPYIRSALIDEAVKREDIQQEKKYLSKKRVRFPVT